MSWIHVCRPGLLTTVQDHGRWGFQGSGVPVAGPMDDYAFRLANLLVGNDERAAGLEVTLVGPEIEFEGEAVFAVAGAEFTLTLDDASVRAHAPCRAGKGARLRFGARRRGARAYLALAGGLDVPVVLGSRATHVLSGMGGVDGRPLAAGDRLPLAPPAPDGGRLGHRLASPPPMPDGGARVRVVWGPHTERFDVRSQMALQAGRYIITADSNRMGYRLEGPELTHAGGADLISEAMPIGGLQVPASGQPILLMADRQTTGGYPILGTVITADLPVVGQLAPGDWLEFEACDLPEAMGALIARERSLLRLAPDRAHPGTEAAP